MMGSPGAGAAETGPRRERIDASAISGLSTSSTRIRTRAMETLPATLPVPSAYERQALGEILLYKQPDRMGWFGRAVDGLNRGLYEVTGLVRKIPGVDWAIENVVAGLLRLTNEIVRDSVWTDAIHKEYRSAGHAVYGRDDIRRLDLADVDRVLDGLDAKYRALAAVEGAATGYAGLPGIVPDVVALVALNLRAVGEYAAYCGFDLHDDHERLYAIQLLDAVSTVSDVSKQVTLAPIVRVSQKLARNQAAQAIEQMALTRAIRNAVQSLGVHLTAAKAAQIVPVTGAVVGSGYNAYYTSKVCDAAFFLYRERFLLHKYGPSVYGEGRSET